MSTRTKDVAAAVLIFVIVIAAYWQVRKLWWTYDDAYLIHTALTHTPRAYFFSRSFWRHEAAFQMFVPFLFSSYDAVTAISGPFDARLFYVLSVLGLAIAASVGYFVARLWVPPPPAFCAALLFALGAPSCAIATQLMASPYIISTLLAFLALIAFEKKHSITSSLLYFGASLAKEIAVPLPLVLLILPNGDLRDRVRRTAPHFVAAAVYLLWRRMMLGTFFGGYGWAPRIGELVIALPRKLWSTIAGPDVWLASAFLLFTGALIVAQFCNLSFLWRATVALILSIAPIVPVSRDMQTRWAFAAWICWVALFIAAVTLAQISDALRASACIVAAVLAMAVNRTEWQMDFGKARRMSDEARLFMRLGRNDLVRSPETPASAMNEFRWMKQHLLHEPSGGWFYDDFYICTGRAAGRTIRPAAPNASQFCASIRSRAPLNAQFQYDGKVLSWSLGPYSDGTWRFVFDDGAEAYDVPGSDAFQIGSVQTMALRIRYSSPAGWITYSPNLVLDLAHQRDIAWHR